MDTFVVGFSVPSNIGKLMAIAPSSPTSSRLGCLDGIRFLSMAWVVIGHVYGLAVLKSIPASNARKAVEQVTPWK